MYNPLEPTRGIVPSAQTWLDLQFGIFDSSGQELDDLLNNKDDQDHLLAFEDTNFTIYIFDYTIWSSNFNEVFEDIKKIQAIINEYGGINKLILIMHKIDLININKRQEIINDVEIISYLIKYDETTTMLSVVKLLQIMFLSFNKFLK